MQLNAFFPSLDIGSDPAKIRDWAQAAEDLRYAYIDLRSQLGHLPKCEKCHVWTAPAMQEESDVSAKRSGAAMYPAFECSRYGRRP
jgi:hypothetical protein